MNTLGHSKYLLAVCHFADQAIAKARDTYGPKHTPLFVDAVHVETRAPAVWHHKGAEWIMSNLANQQIFFRTLVGLSTLTGQQRYRGAAVKALQYAFAHLRSPNGLLHWGGHCLYDAGSDSHVGEGYRHELKASYPFYDLLWQVDSQATRQFVEALWCAHILDWKNLDMNRHGSFTAEAVDPWDHQYDGGPVFFLGQGLTFVNAGSDLIYAAALLHKFTNDSRPLLWAKRLARRYVQTRDSSTGLGGYQYSQISKPVSRRDASTAVESASRISVDRAQLQFGAEFDDLAIEGKLLDHRRSLTRYPRFSLCQMALAEALGPAGDEFLHWAHEDLAAFGHHVYDPQDNQCQPMFSDGTRLDPQNVASASHYRSKDIVPYYSAKSFQPYPARGLFFYAYAKAFRLTRAPFMWEMVRHIARGNDLGNLGDTNGDRSRLHDSSPASDPLLLLGLVELIRTTHRKDLLDLGCRLGDNILDQRCIRGQFVSRPDQIFAKLDAVEPLALLHLESAIRGQAELVPPHPASRPWFHCDYDGLGRTTDLKVIYDQDLDEEYTYDQDLDKE